MLLHLSYYQITCDTCGKQICGKFKTDLKMKWATQGGIYLKGGKCFCSEECYKIYNERLRNEANH